MRSNKPLASQQQGTTNSNNKKSTIVRTATPQDENSDYGSQNMGYQSGGFTTTSPPTPTHVGNIKPNYYAEARKQQENQASTGDWLYQVITDMLSYIYTSISTITTTPNNNKNEFPQPELFLDFAVKKRLDEFKQFVSKTYDPNNAFHEKQLLQLWRICMPHVELSHRISQQWKQLGFQGKWIHIFMIVFL